MLAFCRAVMTSLVLVRSVKHKLPAKAIKKGLLKEIIFNDLISMILGVITLILLLTLNSDIFYSIVVQRDDTFSKCLRVFLQGNSNLKIIPVVLQDGIYFPYF